MNLHLQESMYLQIIENELIEKKKAAHCDNQLKIESNAACVEFSEHKYLAQMRS